MNPDLFKEVVDFISENEYPTLATKGERFVIKRRAANYILQDGELYYIKNKGTAKELRLKVLCGSEAADQVFQEFHCSSFGAHCGQIKTRDAICKRYYWPGMTLDIDGWVSSCVVCQSKGCSIKKNVEYTPILVNSPFELVGMDLIGKLSTTEDGHQYICVMIDYFTKWPQAYPLKSKSASEVTKCIVKFFHQFEAPKRILTDQGKEFVNAINRDVCEILGIKRSLCAPYHPQTNGLVEKMNATIQRALGKLVSSKPNMWDQYLDAVMFGLRTKKQITTKHSPFFLMFGREARYPSEIPEHYQVGTEVEEVVAEEEVFSGINQQEKIFQVLRKQNVDAAEKKKQDSREKIQCTYNTGDLVWRQNIRSQQRKGGKLDPDFLGPFTVTGVEGKSADLVDSSGKVLPKVSIDHLKPYIEEMPRIPHKLKANTKPQNINTASTNLSASAATIPASTTTNTSTISSAPTTTTTSTISSASTTTNVFTASSTTNAYMTSSATTTTTASTISSASTTTTTSTISSASTTTNVFTASSTTNAYMTSSATTTTPASNISHDTVESYITDAWNGKAPHVLLSRIGPYAVFFWDIARTAPNQELEDSVMNSYLLILVRRYNETHREEALSIDSFEMSQIWKNEKTKLKIDPMRFNIILGIINQHHHWMLMIIFPKQQRAILLDPFKATPLKLRRCLQSTRTFMKGRGCAVGKWTCETLPHPVQKDSVSCGVFSLKFAEKVLCNETADRIEFPSSKEDLDLYRKEIARTVLEETDDLSEMCLYCGLQDGTKPKSKSKKNKHDSTVNWIQCEHCCRWFHQECVGNEEDFLCPACTYCNL